jgi:hypothetical protein
MMGRKALRIVVALMALAGIAITGGYFYELYGRWNAGRVVSRTLSGYSRDAVPADVKFLLEAKNKERMAEALRAGFEVESMDNILWSHRSFEVWVRLANGLTLHCDLYHTPAWNLKCWE